MDSVDFVLELHGQCEFCFGTVWTVWILELYEQCGFCFGTVWTVWILLWNCMNSVDFGTVWTVWILFWNCMDSVDFALLLFILFTRRRKTKQKQNTICVGHQYSQANTNNLNKTQVLLQTTGGKDQPNIVFIRKS